MNEVSYISADFSCSWPVTFAGACMRVLNDMEQISVVVQWRSNLPGGRLLECLAWLKGVTVVNGNFKLGVDEIGGVNAGLYVADFAEVYLVKGSVYGSSLRFTVSLLRPNGDESDQKYHFDLPYCEICPESEMRFPI